MWIAKNKIWNADLKVFTHKPVRNSKGYWEDLKVIDYDKDRRYGFIVSISDVMYDKSFTWEDEPQEVKILVPIKEHNSQNSKKEREYIKRSPGDYPLEYMRDSWYGD